MPLFTSFTISGSALTAHRLWLDLIASNLANINTAGRPGDPVNPPYRRRVPVFAPRFLDLLDESISRQEFKKKGAGVMIQEILADPAEPRLVYEPDHPLADPQTGYVAYPNINVASEMVNLIAATRTYEANVAALNAARNMHLKALEIGRA